jgi:hypothetical protein
MITAFRTLPTQMLLPPVLPSNYSKLDRQINTNPSHSQRCKSDEQRKHLPGSRWAGTETRAHARCRSRATYLRLRCRVRQNWATRRPATGHVAGRGDSRAVASTPAAVEHAIRTGRGGGGGGMAALWAGAWSGHRGQESGREWSGVEEWSWRAAGVLLPSCAPRAGKAGTYA